MFGPLLEGLSSAMRNCSVTSRAYMRVFESLDLLTDIKAVNSSSRPICNLMVSMVGDTSRIYALFFLYLDGGARVVFITAVDCKL